MESFNDLYNINLYNNIDLCVASYKVNNKSKRNSISIDANYKIDNKSIDANKTNNKSKRNSTSIRISNDEFKKYMFKNAIANHNDLNYRIMTEDQITINVNDIQILHEDFWNIESINNNKFIDANGQRKPLMMIGETYLQIQKFTDRCYNIKTIFIIKKFSKEICEGKYTFFKEIDLNNECLKKSVINKYSVADTENYEQRLLWKWFLDKQFPNILPIGLSAYPINLELYEVNNYNKIIAYFDKFLIITTEENNIFLQGQFSFENVFMNRDEITLVMDTYINTTT